jgi:hypothetical protein
VHGRRGCRCGACHILLVERGLGVFLGRRGGQLCGGERDSELVGVLLLRQHDLLCLDVMA